MNKAARVSLPVLVALALAGCASEPPDPQRDAVRAYLRENLDDGDFEEVRWWPVKPLPEVNTVFAEKWRASRDDWQKLGDAKRAAEAEGEAKAAEAEPVPQVARLKYRTTNKAGASELRDALFVFEADGRVGMVISEGDRDPIVRVWERRDRLFPE